MNEDDLKDRLDSKGGPLSKLCSLQQLENLSELMAYLRGLPYGRSSIRGRLDLVIAEQKGTCSSKHAFLAAVANEQGWDYVQLILCLYDMREANTPGVGKVLSQAGMDSIPEAHCYVTIRDRSYDLTFLDSDLGSLVEDIKETKVIQPDQIGQWKVEYHRAYLELWCQNNHPDRSMEEIWRVRERCIKQLETER